MRHVVALAALAVVLVACGGSEDESRSADGGAHDPIVAAPANEAVGAAGGTDAAAPGDDGAGGAAEVERETGGDEAEGQETEGQESEAGASETGASATPLEGATLWVTRNAGAELVLQAAVDAGVTVVQALDGAAEIETRYGGRFVTNVEGIGGDSDLQEDWFFMVNGVEPDIGAAELKVDDGDVIWWDHRSWIDGGGHPAAVVGAFPYPFHRGWKGQVRAVEVNAPAVLDEAAAALQAFLSATAPDDPEAEPHRFVLELNAESDGAELTASMGSKNGSAVTFVLAGGEDAVRAAVATLIETPAVIAHRYSASFDASGRVVAE